MTESVSESSQAVAAPSEVQNGTVSIPPRALSEFAVAESSALVLAAAVFVGLTGRYLQAILIGAAGFALPVYVRKWQDSPRDRREALAIGALVGIAGLAFVQDVGRSGIPLLLVPAALCSAFDFGHWRFSDDPDDLADLEQRSSRLDGSIVALLPAYLGGAILIGSGKGTGTAVLALLAAPWLYSAPAVTVFLTSSRPLAEELTTRARGRIAFVVRRDLHKRVVAAKRHIDSALEVAHVREVNADLLEILAAASRRCDQAQDRAFLRRRHFDEELERR